MPMPEPQAAASPEAADPKSPSKNETNDHADSQEKPTTNGSNVYSKPDELDNSKKDDTDDDATSTLRNDCSSDKPEKSSDSEIKEEEEEEDVVKSSDAVESKDKSTDSAAIADSDRATESFVKNKGEVNDATMADVSMEDVPAPAKVPRERDDDDDDDENEPLAKRTKLDTPEDSAAPTPAAPVPAIESVAPVNGTGLNGLDSLTRWNDEELEKQLITPYQAREYRRVLAGIKKTKGGAHFKDAVIRLWPTLTEAYLARVTKPMDIGTLERTLRDEPWATLGEFKENLALIYLNTKAFNGELHDITLAGLSVVEAVWTKCLAISASEPTRPKVPAKQMPPRHHEQRQSISHQPPAAAAQSSLAPSNHHKAKASSTPAARRAASPAANKASGTDTYAVPANGVPLIRRASALTESDRPKRTIHPPKSKDIDYGKGGKKKSMKPELEFCEEVLIEIRNPRHYDINAAFLDPVDPVALDIPNYFQVIKKPMDLSTINAKLQTGEYPNTKQFLGDVDLMFRNCYMFNSPGTPVNLQGKALEKLFREEWAKKDEWLSRHAASKAAAGAASARSDDELFEEEVAPRAHDSNLDSEIQAFEEKLKQETQKLLDMYLEDTPNKAMIDLQATMLNVIQDKVLDSKSRRAESKPESRPTKSKPKPPRAPKPAPAPPAKKANNSGRKSLSGGGAKKRRNITEADKGLIATAINELSGNAIESAIDIIKRDTNQTENNNGELELDIDQLSPEALNKLWDLCKKNLADFGRTTAPISPESTPSQPVNSAAAAAAARQPKPKKNKPMSAREQEARIAHLTQVREQFRGGNLAGASPEPMSDHAMDSEEESDSEEE